MNRKAVVSGVVIYVGLYVLHLLAIPLFAQVADRTDPFSMLWVLNQFLGFATVGVSGFVAGRIAGKRRLMHGFVVGGLGTVISALAALLVSAFTGREAPVLLSVILWMVTNGFLSGLAAGLSENYDRDKADGNRQSMRF